MRQLLQEYLTEQGYHVLTATDGQNALYTARHQQPDLILLDLMMPVMDGRQFRAAQRADPSLAGIPVVVITAGGDRGPQTEMAVQGWLGKPVELDTLLDSVRRNCRR